MTFLVCRPGSGADESGEVGFMAAHDLGDDEQDRGDGGAAAAHWALALSFAAVASERRQAGQLAGGSVREGADLGQVGQEASDSAVGHAP